MPKQDNAQEAALGAKPEEAKDGAPQGAAKAAGEADSISGKGVSAQTDPIALLKADHRKVEQLFAQYEAASDDGLKGGLITQICAELSAHTIIEEEIFYPACRRAASEEELLDEAQVEHDSAKVLIVDLMNGRPDDPYRDAKVSVLAEQIKHHVAEEEEPRSGIFAKAQAAGVATPELAKQLQSRKQALQAEPDRLRPSRPVSLQLRSTTPNKGPKEDDMARQGTPERDENGRFAEEHDNRGSSNRGYAARGSGRDRDEHENDERGWYGDPEGHSEASRRGWAARRGEQRSFGRHEEDDRGHYGRERDERSRYADEDDRQYGARSGSKDRDRDDYGRFVSDEDGRYASRGEHRDERGRYAADDEERYASRGRYAERDEDDRRRYGARSAEGEGRGWYGDSRGHADAARRGWEERERGGRTYARDDDQDRGGYRGRDEDNRGGRSDSSGHGGWYGDSRGHAEASRRGWENRR